MTGGASASPGSVLRSRGPRTRLETSCTRTGDLQGVSAPSGSRLVREGGSRTVGMYAPEESDHATVPMKLLNKEGQPSVKAVEGRAWPKGDTARSHRFPTQSGRTRAPGVGRCAAGSSPPISDGGAVCANERRVGRGSCQFAVCCVVSSRRSRLHPHSVVGVGRCRSQAD
jgi:hypothetical protein